ncbi:YcgL domain-containing protein [Agaribacterium sp. ZY112]|uniref:YcgL domain-containing protein n=1 Tax=Agaribacterium sp. ZY112 TaxID=3233574 RepID=UPI0035240ACF
MKTLVDIYRSGKKEGLYLYVNRGQDLLELPEALLKSFGQPEYAMGLALDEDKQLARVKAKDVLEQLKEQKFFLQMPPKISVEEQLKS